MCSLTTSVLGCLGGVLQSLSFNPHYINFIKEIVLWFHFGFFFFFDCNMWYGMRDLSSLTRGRTCALCSE